MTPFCTDIDLLHWEPNICRDASFASQTLMSGTRQSCRHGLTISSGSFVDSHIEPNRSGSQRQRRRKFPIFSRGLRDVADDQRAL